MGLINNILNRKQKKEQLSKIGESKSASIVAAKEKKVKKVVKDQDHSDHDHAAHAPSEKKAEKKVSVVAKTSNYPLAFKVLIKPLVTEKSAVAESKNKYSFVVLKSANKDQIKKAVEEIYGVRPVNVNVVNVEGRQVRFGRSMGRRSDYKKAIITLPSGKTIDIHTGV